MERADRRQSVQRAFGLLAQQLLPNDQVTLIGFARQPRLLADQISGSELRGKLASIVANTPSASGPNLEAALKLAMEKAEEQKLDGAQNRVVLLTDGAANLGDAEPGASRDWSSGCASTGSLSTRLASAPTASTTKFSKP